MGAEERLLVDELVRPEGALLRVTAERTANDGSASAGAGAGDFAAEALLRLAWEGIAKGLALYDDAGRRLLANQAAAEIAPLGDGVGPREIYLADGVSVCPEPAWPLRRALRGEVVRNEELVVRGDLYPQGRRLLVSAYPVQLPDGRRGALVDFDDVTARWADELARRNAFDQLSMLLDGMDGCAVLLLNPEGEIAAWSGGAERLTGYPPEAVVGQTYATLFAAADRLAGRPASILARAQSEASVPTADPWPHADGSVLWLDGMITATRDRMGTVIGFLQVSHDVTRQRQTEQSLEKLNATLVENNQRLEDRVRDRTAQLQARTAELLNVSTELETFSYSVSHDLRAPVRVVQGFARILRDRYGELLPEDGRRYLDRIEIGAVRMGDLVNAMLRLSRMQRQTMATSLVDMAELVRRCWHAVSADRPGHQVELSLLPLPSVEGDLPLLQQVWMNLLDNAIKYSAGRSQARVEVSATMFDDVVVYRVSDNGAGFDSRHADRLFQSFQRLHSSEDFTGIGIGLAIVHRVLLRHGGRVWADSEIGVGSTFCFELKRVSDAG